jgi:hypothetical protein
MGRSAALAKRHEEKSSKGPEDDRAAMPAQGILSKMLALQILPRENCLNRHRHDTQFRDLSTSSSHSLRLRSRLQGGSTSVMDLKQEWLG